MAIYSPHTGYIHYPLADIRENLWQLYALISGQLFIGFGCTLQWVLTASAEAGATDSGFSTALCEHLTWLYALLPLAPLLLAVAFGMAALQAYQRQGRDSPIDH